MANSSVEGASDRCAARVAIEHGNIGYGVIGLSPLSMGYVQVADNATP